MSELQYHVNGELVAAPEASVSVRDRGFRYGDAAFETVRVYDGEVFEWAAHAARLEATCEALEIDHGLDESELRDRVQETLAANGLSEAYVRLSITRGPQTGKLTPSSTTDPGVVILVDELPRGGTQGDDVWTDPASADVVQTRRIPGAAIPAHAKTHNYLNGILARLETEADEALLRDGDGNVVEGATSNVFLCSEGTLQTPALDGPVLPGITRSVVLELADELGIPTECRTYDESALREADEVFLTNTTWEVRPTAVAGCEDAAGGPVTRELRDAFDRRVERVHYE